MHQFFWHSLTLLHLRILRLALWREMPKICPFLTLLSIFTPLLLACETLPTRMYVNFSCFYYLYLSVSVLVWFMSSNNSCFTDNNFYRKHCSTLLTVSESDPRGLPRAQERRPYDDSWVQPRHQPSHGSGVRSVLVPRYPRDGQAGRQRCRILPVPGGEHSAVSQAGKAICMKLNLVNFRLLNCSFIFLLSYIIFIALHSRS